MFSYRALSLCPLVFALAGCLYLPIGPSTPAPGPMVPRAQAKPPVTVPPPTLASRMASPAIATPQAAGPSNAHWITNPTSSVRLYTQVVTPKTVDGKLPALVLVPGGIGWGGNFLGSPNQAQQLADAGFVVVVFDPDGRGKSGGREDFDGHVHQDGLAAVVRFAAGLDEVDAGRIGIVTYSYGITMGSGALARHADLPVKFLIDWEGPADRNTTTTGCDLAKAQGKIQWQPCTDQAFWSEREAVNFVGKMRVPYQRIQSQKDHVQPSNKHAVDLINAAVKGGVPWVRLNDYAPNQTYDPKAPPQMLPDQLDRQVEQRIAQYAIELLSQ